jgi:protein-tyrosine phosphatase
MTSVLFLCTGNICRSPMAEALLRHRLEERGIEANIHSAGLLDDGRVASEYGVDEMRKRGIDLSSHRSRRMARQMIADADLVVAMAREHLREAVVLAPQAFPRAYTLKELIRRGSAIGGRAADEPLDDWLRRAHGERKAADLMGGRPDDDVADPIGGSPADYEATAAELEELVGRMVGLVWGVEHA